MQKVDKKREEVLSYGIKILLKSRQGEVKDIPLLAIIEVKKNVISHTIKISQLVIRPSILIEHNPVGIA